MLICCGSYYHSICGCGSCPLMKSETTAHMRDWQLARLSTVGAPRCQESLLEKRNLWCRQNQQDSAEALRVPHLRAGHLASTADVSCEYTGHCAAKYCPKHSSQGAGVIPWQEVPTFSQSDAQPMGDKFAHEWR